MAYAEKRGSGPDPWRARWQLPERLPNGRHKEGHQDGFRTRKLAEKYGEAQEAAIRAGTWIDPKRSETLLRDWWAEWFPAQEFRPNTRESYAQQWRKHIDPKWGGSPLGAIRGIDMQKWTNELRASLAASTVTVILAPLRLAFADAVFNNLIARSPMPPAKKHSRARAVPEGRHKREGVVVPLDQVEQIMLRVRPAEALMILTALFTGMRWGELSSMRRSFLTLRQPSGYETPHGYYLIDPSVGAVWEDVHSHRFLGPPKSGSTGSLGPGYKPGRVVDLPAFLVTLLSRYIATLDEDQDILFPDRKGHYRQYDNWNSGPWRRACDGKPAAVLPTGHAREAVPPVHEGLRLHDLKHTHKAIMNNGRIHTAMQDYRLGHISPGTPGVYSHPTPEMRQELLGWLDEVWRAWSPHAVITWFDSWLGDRLPVAQRSRSTPKLLPGGASASS